MLLPQQSCHFPVMHFQFSQTVLDWVCRTYFGFGWHERHSWYDIPAVVSFRAVERSEGQTDTELCQFQRFSAAAFVAIFYNSSISVDPSVQCCQSAASIPSVICRFLSLGINQGSIIYGSNISKMTCRLGTKHLKKVHLYRYQSRVLMGDRRYYDQDRILAYRAMARDALLHSEFR